MALQILLSLEGRLRILEILHEISSNFTLIFMRVITLSFLNDL